jgi:enoyl-[acyl-carrier protein] reductase II
MQTKLCELVGIDLPIVQAGMSIYTSPTLAAAVSNAGALGSLGIWQRPVEQVRGDLELLRELTDRPFALNHVVPDLNDEAFQLTLQAAPAVMAFALDDAGSLIPRVHDVGSLAMQQVHTVEQAERSAEHGADIIVAQGSEAGGYGGAVPTFALVPQVVDAVRPVPVIAAGGISDGRGLVAALALGAAGVNLGTRFLACDESPVSEGYREAILRSASQDWRQFEYHNVVRPNPGTRGYGTRVRLLQTSFTEKHEARLRQGHLSTDDVEVEMLTAAEQGQLDEFFVCAGQSAGMIHTTIPAARILRDIANEAEDAYRRVGEAL